MSEESNQDTHIGRDANAANMNFGSQTFEQPATFNYNTTKPKSDPHCPKTVNRPLNFGGREEPLERIISLLINGGNRQAVAITAVHGMGGIGKTTLAEQIAFEMVERKLVHAVLWGNVNQKPDATKILSNWVMSYADVDFDIAAITDPVQAAFAAKAKLDSVIQQKCELCEPPLVLVVLDNVWDDGKETVRLLQKALPDNAVVLMTTRSENVADELHAYAEKLYTLDTNGREILEFLLAYLPSAPQKQVSDDDLRALGKSLGGHALALKLSTERVKKDARRSGNTLAKALQACTQDYERGIPAGESFNHLRLDRAEKSDENLTTSLYYSYAALSEEDQWRFRQLGVLVSEAPFHITLLAELWQVELDTVEEYCDVLRTASLLESTDDKGFYSQHSLLRAYGRALLIDDSEIETAFGRYSDFVIQQLKKFDTSKPKNLRQLDLISSHIQEVGDGLEHRWNKSMSGNADSLLLHRCGDFALNVKNYVRQRSFLVEKDGRIERQGLSWLSLGLAIFEQKGSFSEQTVLLNEIAFALAALGDKRKALKLYEAALVIDDILKDDYGKAVTLNNMGKLWRELGNLNEAIRFYLAAWTIFKERGSSHDIVGVLNNIGMISYNSARYAEALNYYSEAMTLIKFVKDRELEATIFSNIGLALQNLGDGFKALNYYQKALKLFRRSGGKNGEAFTLNNIGTIWLDRNQPDKALNFLHESLRICRAIGELSTEVTALNNLAHAYHRLNKSEKTIEILRSIILTVNNMGAVGQEATFRANLAMALKETAQPQEAIVELLRAIQIMETHDLTNAVSGVTVQQYQTLLSQWVNERE